MKHTLSLLILIVFSLCLCGCSAKDKQHTRSEVEINLPKDDSVNGYRITTPTEDNSSKMPEIIEADGVKIETEVPDDDGISSEYCGNKNSKVFHKINCGSAANTKESNRVYLKSRDEFIQKGYSPCSRCEP